MPRCNKSEGHAIDYASKLLSAAEAEAFEQHLKNCSDCNEAVESFMSVLNLTDMAEREVAVPEAALQDIEINVYKRLAATQKASVFSRLWKGFLTPIANFGSLFRGYKIAAVSTAVIALITAVVLVGEFWRPKVELQLSESQSADARIEQYRQQDIQRNLEDALITHHLRNDAWETESRLQRVKEQAEGTDWMKFAQAFSVNSTTQANVKGY